MFTNEIYEGLLSSFIKSIKVKKNAGNKGKNKNKGTKSKKLSLEEKN